MRIREAAAYLGVSQATLRNYTRDGKVKFYLLGEGKQPERRFYASDLDKVLGREPDEFVPERERVEAFYTRVSSTSGQETSLENQKDMLARTSQTKIHKTYSDKGSGLSTKRKGLNRMLFDAKEGKFTVLRITHPDRLTRFGYEYLEELLAAYGVRIEVLKDTPIKSDTEELLDDFMALVSSFAGRVYGMRSREHKKALLDKAAQQNE